MHRSATQVTRVALLLARLNLLLHPMVQTSTAEAPSNQLQGLENASTAVHTS